MAAPEMPDGALYRWFDAAATNAPHPSATAAVDWVFRHAVGLPNDFPQRAAAYAALGTRYCRHALSGNADWASLPITSRGCPEWTEVVEAEAPALLVMSHTGMWNGIAPWASRIRRGCTFLIDETPEPLIAIYRSLGFEPLVASGDVVLHLAGGDRLRVEGTRPLALVQAALAAGKQVGMFGDSYRPRGNKVQLLGIEVPLNYHYALVATKVNCPVFVLDHWTTPDALHFEVHAVQTYPETRTRERIERIVSQYAAILDRRLRNCPEQYAYVPECVFAWRARELGEAIEMDRVGKQGSRV